MLYVQSRAIPLKRINRRGILLGFLASQNRFYGTVLGYRTLQWPHLRFPDPVYPKRRKPIWLLGQAIVPTTATVPNVGGFAQADAVSAISGAGLTTTASTGTSATVPAGSVISQNPAPLTTVPTGSAVLIVVSIGNLTATVPNVVGLTQAAAANAVAAAGLTIAISFQIAPQVGNVIVQTPAGGTMVVPGSLVAVIVAIAPPPPAPGTWPRPSTVTNLPGRGAWELPGGQQALWVFGSACFLMTVDKPATAFTPATFSMKKVGSLVTATGPVCIRDNGAGGMAVIVDGPNGYLYNIATQSLSQITDPAFLGADRVAFIDGWWVFNQPGTQTFYVPQSTYSTVFNASNFALADAATDKLVTLHENKEELWLVGEKHTEIWYDAGGTFFPFQRLVSTMLQVGCSAKHSIARFSTEGEDGLIWFGRSERGENVILRTRGFVVEVVSTPAVSDEIATYAVVADAIGYVYQEDGHEFYVLTFPTADVTWVYDGLSKMWHKRASYDPYADAFHRHRSSCFLNFQNQRLVGDYQNGSVYQMTRKAYTDAGWPLLALRRAPHIWDGGARERVFMASLQVEFAPGTGNEAGAAVNPQATLRISRDGGRTWSQDFQRAMGAVGQYLNRVIWRRLSFSRDSVVEISVIDPVNRDIVGANLKRMS